jgi:hypothetical protein
MVHDGPCHDGKVKHISEKLALDLAMVGGWMLTGMELNLEKNSE